MGGGVGGVRVSISVGEAMASGMVAARRSEGLGGKKRPTAARALASGTVSVWDSIGKPFIFGSSGVWDGRRDGDGKTLVLVILGQHGRRSWGQKGGVWWRQRGCWRQVSTASATARASELELAAAISVSKGVNVGDSSRQGHRRWGHRQIGRQRWGRRRRRCYVHGWQ